MPFPICTTLLALSLFAHPIDGAKGPNLIPNGDFSQGNVGFTSELPYIKPSFNCLWGGYYTIAPRFDKPQLHELIAPEAFPPAGSPNPKNNVFYANAGGKEAMVVWSTKVKCQPNTRYQISFNVISLSGYPVPGPPPHQVATSEWAPDFEIWTNGEPSPPIQAGLGEYVRVVMNWDSKTNTTAQVNIVRDKIAHGGGLIGISDIQMVSVRVTGK